MLPVQVHLRIIGKLRPRFESVSIPLRYSVFFKIQQEPSADDEGLGEPPIGLDGYTDQQIQGVLPSHGPKSLTIGIIDAPLSDGYYMRRLSENRAVISTHEIAPLLLERGYPLGSFLYRNIYQLVVAFIRFDGSLPTTASIKLAHMQTRGCLFDWNDTKEDILNSLDKPTLCPSCLKKLSGTSVGYLFPYLERELSFIRRPVLVQVAQRLRAAVEARPVISIVVAVTGGIALNIAASYIYDALNPK